MKDCVESSKYKQVNYTVFLKPSPAIDRVKIVLYDDI